MESKDRKEIFKEMVRAGKRTYFFDVHEASNGNLYLVISERIKKEDGYEGKRVMVFEDDILAFNKGFKKAVKFIFDKVVA